MLSTWWDLESSQSYTSRYTCKGLSGLKLASETVLKGWSRWVMSWVCEWHHFLWAGLLDCTTRRKWAECRRSWLSAATLSFLILSAKDRNWGLVCVHMLVYVWAQTPESMPEDSLWESVFSELVLPFNRVSPGAWTRAVKLAYQPLFLHWAISLDLFFASWLWMQVTKRSQTSAVMMSLPWWPLPQNCEPEKKKKKNSFTLKLLSLRVFYHSRKRNQDNVHHRRDKDHECKWILLSN